LRRQIAEYLFPQALETLRRARHSRSGTTNRTAE
jgi:hypothetical protein